MMSRVEKFLFCCQFTDCYKLEILLYLLHSLEMKALKYVLVGGAVGCSPTTALSD